MKVVTTSFQGRKLGAVLLADAIARVARADIASFAVVVDPKDDSARQFYKCHGFIDLPQPERRMFVPIEAALRLNEALMLWMEARDQHRSAIRVAALVEDGTINLSSNKAQRAFNRIDTTAIFRGDEKAAIDRIERVALPAAA